MARSRFAEPVNDLMTDSGGILWSIVKGEQLEFPVVLNFLDDATLPYVFEAVVVEGANVNLQEEPPVVIQTAGVKTTLTLRLPNYVGVWNGVAAYDAEDIVLHGGLYYRLTSGAAYTNAVTPDLDTNWAVTTLNVIYVQFPLTLASTWAVQPMVDYPTYGFFELRVTEPNNSIYVRTWKPVRGLVEILFSPTDMVP